MSFFKKLKFKLACRKTAIFFPLLVFSFLEFTTFTSSLSNKPTPSVLALLISLALLGAFIAIFVHNSDSDEYREAIRQAKIIGDLDSVGKMIDSLKKVPVKDGVLKFNDKLIFYSNTYGTRIIVASKITKIFMNTSFYRCKHYNVCIRYRIQNAVTIEMFSAETARALCEALKTTTAPHLLANDTFDEDED